MTCYHLFHNWNFQRYLEYQIPYFIVADVRQTRVPVVATQDAATKVWTGGTRLHAALKNLRDGLGPIAGAPLRPTTDCNAAALDDLSHRDLCGVASIPAVECCPFYLLVSYSDM